MNTFGSILKSLRSEKGIFGKELADILKVHKGSISNWETDRRSPDKEMLNTIADYFGVTADYLLGRTDKRNLHIEERPKLDEGIISINAKKINIDEDLPDDAIEKINEYIKMVEMMYKNKK
ncbi:MAG: helix-turn-helix transcriptional regulator [Romboutsia sp.]